MSTMALFGCAMAILAWGSAGIFDKLAMKTVDPFMGVLVRMVMVTTTVLVFCAATDRLRPALELPSPAYLYLFISGLLGALIGQLGIFIALKYAPVTQVVPMVASYPAVAFLLAVLFLREQPTLPKIVGLLLVVGGLMLLSSARAAPPPEEKAPVASTGIVTPATPEDDPPGRAPG